MGHVIVCINTVMQHFVCTLASGAKLFLLIRIKFCRVPWRRRWDVYVAVATAARPLSSVRLLMMHSSSQTITRDTRTDEGNMSSLSCQEGLQAVDVQMLSAASKCGGSEESCRVVEVCDEGRPTFTDA